MSLLSREHITRWGGDGRRVVVVDCGERGGVRGGGGGDWVGGVERRYWSHTTVGSKALTGTDRTWELRTSTSTYLSCHPPTWLIDCIATFEVASLRRCVHQSEAWTFPSTITILPQPFSVEASQVPTPLAKRARCNETYSLLSPCSPGGFSHSR